MCTTRSPPVNHVAEGGKPAPVEVHVEITIQDISDISAITGTFVIDFWISAIWLDSRLAFHHIDPCRKNLSLDHDMEPRLWSPNVCVVNSKLTKVHDSPKPNILLMIFPNGTVWLNYRVRSEAPCQMDLRTFPLDSIKCTLLLESYSYNSAEVSLRWLEWSPVSTVKNDYNLPDFKMSNMTYDSVTETYTAGLWHRLAVSIQFERLYGFYILQASYVKAIDIWMFSCVGFIFFSLIELAIVAYNDKIDDQRLRGTGLSISSSNGNSSAMKRSIAEITLRRSKGSELGASIDKAASIAFPIVS
ncbi:unnamed protein product [Nippostrongylus brasiliensis]|uniref:Neur_chan_LBD domain-containing protein n=1 Tax=Nippostrongylus brasiliensis TaxID=27835 RepID=A0A158QZZ0_NIPBR|nr:unnamed protein product [Nippostrongylus brasiliensis]